MERARAKAREIGRNLLMRARGDSDSSEDDRQIAEKPKWSEVVARSHDSSAKVASFSGPGSHGNGSNVHFSDNSKAFSGPGRHGTAYGDHHRAVDRRTSPGMAESPQKVFTADDVAKLVELARSQLKKENANKSGWIEVETREGKKKERTYVQTLVDGYRTSPESEPICWQCGRHGHLSSSCPRGERCFACNSPSHKRADCPSKRRATRAEKGKAVEEVAAPVSIKQPGPLWIGERQVGGRRSQANVNQFSHRATHIREEAHRGGEKPVLVKEVRTSAPVLMPQGNRNQANMKLSSSNTPAATTNNSRPSRRNLAAPVYLIKSEAVLREKEALEATGGAVSRANGHPSVKDYIDKLKKM